MVKRFSVVLVLLVVIAGGAFALPEFGLSAGAGGYFTSDFGGGVDISASGYGSLGSVKTPYIGGGGFLFFDGTFAELSAGFFAAGGNWKTSDQSIESDFFGLGIDISLLGKFPFEINDQFSVFPLLGATYRIVVSAKADGEKVDDPMDLSAIWFKAGGGLDFSFTDNFFLRGELLYGIRLKNKFESDLIDLAAGSQATVKALLGHGLEVKIGVGYRF